MDKQEAWVKEFPFLNRIFDLRRIDKIKVERLDLDFMRKEYDGGDISACFIISHNGEVLLRVGIKQNQHPFSMLNPLSWKRKTRFKESVSEAMVRLGEQAETVECFVDYMNLYDHLTRKLTIVKSPKGYSAMHWINKCSRFLDHSIID